MAFLARLTTLNPSVMRHGIPNSEGFGKFPGVEWPAGGDTVENDNIGPITLASMVSSSSTPTDVTNHSP